MARGEGVRIVITENALEAAQHVVVHRLGLRPPALHRDGPGQLVEGPQPDGVVLTEAVRQAAGHASQALTGREIPIRVVGAGRGRGDRDQISHLLAVRLARGRGDQGMHVGSERHIVGPVSVPVGTEAVYRVDHDLDRRGTDERCVAPFMGRHRQGERGWCRRSPAGPAPHARRCRAG